MKLKFFFFLFLFASAVMNAQYEELLHQPYKEKGEKLTHIYRSVAESHSSPQKVIAYTNKMKQWAIHHEDLELALEADLIKAYYYYYEARSGDLAVIHPDITEAIQQFEAIVQEAKERHLLNIEERAVYGIALSYWEDYKYEKAFEWLLRCEKILDQMEPDDFPNMALHLNFIGGVYFHFKRYKKAMIYYKKANQLKKNAFNAPYVAEAQSNLGLCYQKLGRLSMAEDCFLKVIHDSSAYQNRIWKGIASGNLGYNYYLQGRYRKAIPLFKIDISNALRIKDYGLAASSAIPLADVYLKQGKQESAKQKLEEAKNYIVQSNQTDRFRKLYPVMSKWYAVNNQPDSSAFYLDLALEANNAYHEKYSSLKLMRANQKVKAQEQQAKVNLLRQQSQLKISQRNFTIIIIVILLTGSVLAYFFRNKYLIREQEVKEVALQTSQENLKNARLQLAKLKTSIHKENKVIDQLQKEQHLQNSTKLVKELKSGIILTQEDWEEFQNLFKKAYPNFIHTLTTTYLTLTPSELRCLCLEKLQLSNKEMALVLGVSTNSIMVTKHRIRKKLELKNQKALQKIVMNIV